jgi:hypothetical protein
MPELTFFYKDTTIQILQDSPLEIDLGIDAGLTDNFYQWSKDSLGWTLPPGNDPNSNKLLFPSPQATDAGRYHVRVTNPQAPSLSLYSHTISLKVCDEQADSLQLVSLYNATGGSNWANKTNWLVPGMPIGTWYGITADAFGCVQKIDLTGNSLAGTLPPLNLNTLDTLILEDNLLAGGIPEMEIPFVRHFNLARNQLSGGFPAVLTGWYDLELLDLGFNELSSTIPPDLGDLCELKALRLNNNQIPGELPEDLTRLFNLQIGQVDFSNNLIDSLRQKIIWFCPFGDSILEINPSYDRFLGICNVQCSGTEWDHLNDFPWIADTLEALDCSEPGCLLRTADAGFVLVRGVRVVFTRTRCYTALSPSASYVEEVRFFDCAGHLLETASCDQDEFCSVFGAISQDEYLKLDYDVRWQCGQSLDVIDNLEEPAVPGSSGLISLRCSPNPAAVFIFCEKEDGIALGSVRVFDLMGRSREVNVQLSPKGFQLDVSLLTPGMYVVAVMGKNARHLAKVVVN